MNRQISEKNYKSAGFAEKYQKLVNNTVIPYQYTVLRDEAEGVEKSHVFKNFINAAKALNGEDTDDGFYGMVFQDSDAAKWIEAAAYTLINFPDGELEEKVDSLIELIEKAQDSDGYLNTYFTVKDKEKRWTNLLEAHELYCAGHMMEAACAYYEATGKDRLLKVMERNAEHIYKHFIEEKHEGYPGHPEVEHALLRMYDTTGNEHFSALAEHFINVRGEDVRYFEKEFEKRDWKVWGGNGKDHYYQQSYAPVREQKDASGHAVRAVYLYTGMSHLAAETGEKELFEACSVLWDSITKKRMYITGGIGSTVNGEAFTVDYDLPSDTAYCETCASVGLIFFAAEMLKSDVDRKYSDVMERAFYNTVLAGMALDGKSFFYVNPLECIPGISGKASTHTHDLTERPGWYACACCPPNAARLIASIGKYAYFENDDTSFCNLFMAGDISFENGMKIKCETDYPYGLTVKYTIERGGKLAVRIPSWAEKSFTLKKNDSEFLFEMKKGYAYLSVSDKDTITLTMNISPVFNFADTNIPELTGMAAVSYGPLVYCFEGADNGDILSLVLNTSAPLKTGDYAPDVLGGIRYIEAEAFRIKTDRDGELYKSKKPTYEKVTVRAVPYYTWGNRGENQMRVWLPYR